MVFTVERVVQNVGDRLFFNDFRFPVHLLTFLH
jgi:hypothetical protein